LPWRPTPLAGGATAVALLNREGTTITVQSPATAVGLAAAGRYTVHDVWSGASRASAGSLLAGVPRFTTVLLRVRG
jgi:alpha-galactosidase